MPKPDLEWFKRFKADVESGNLDREFTTPTDLQTEINNMRQQMIDRGIEQSDYEKVIKIYQQRNKALFSGYGAIGR